MPEILASDKFQLDGNVKYDGTSKFFPESNTKFKWGKKIYDVGMGGFGHEVKFHLVRLQDGPRRQLENTGRELLELSRQVGVAGLFAADLIFNPKNNSKILEFLLWNREFCYFLGTIYSRKEMPPIKASSIFYPKIDCANREDRILPGYLLYPDPVKKYYTSLSSDILVVVQRFEDYINF